MHKDKNVILSLSEPHVLECVFGMINFYTSDTIIQSSSPTVTSVTTILLSMMISACTPKNKIKTVPEIEDRFVLWNIHAFEFSFSDTKLAASASYGLWGP